MKTTLLTGRRLLAVASLAVFTFACADDHVAAPDVQPPLFSVGGGFEATPTDHHVATIRGRIPADFADRVAALGGTLFRTHPEIGVVVTSGLTDQAAAELKRSRGVSGIERDLLVQWRPSQDNLEALRAPGALGPASDPTAAFLYPCQWNMTQINAPGAWSQGEFGSANAKVAVLDGGIDPFHIDLQYRVDVANSVSLLSSPSICDWVVDDVGTINDYDSHGSFVAGLIASNGIGMASVAPGAMIVGVKVLNCLGSGSFGDIIAGILYATNLSDVSVINMSLGVHLPKSLPGAGPLVGALNKAVNYAQTHGKLVVSSAGNEGVDLDHDRNFIHVPSQNGSGIAAWAGDIDGDLAGYSNHGRSGAWVGAGGGDDIDPSPPLASCPLSPDLQGGVLSVCSTTSIFLPICAENGFYILDGVGTSFSAPLVAGVAALLDGKYGGVLNGGQLKTMLAQTADDIGKRGVDHLYSHGRVNAGNAVNQ
ncbi:MAG: S8 family serine peptidase [Gemmatimonadota bacterium]|nr:S8 family serine peptidase [Gemmatimonadota bacterium]